MKITKALSIHQPWLHLILNNYKDIEIRTWNTKHRGLIALYASKKFDEDGYYYIKEHFPTIPLPLKEHFKKGMILGVARIHSVIDFNTMEHFVNFERRHLNNVRFFDGRQKGFVLQDIEEIKPIEFKGQLRLFNVDLDVEAD